MRAFHHIGMSCSRVQLLQGLTYHAGQNDYLLVFCFEGLITEFVEITYRFPSLRASFSSQVKMSETGFIPRGCRF